MIVRTLLIMSVVLFVGCSTLPTQQHEPYMQSYYIGHWVEREKGIPRIRWIFRDDGTFESIEIDSQGFEGHTIIKRKRGAYHFDYKHYSLAYIRTIKTEAPKGRDRLSDVTFAGPTPVIDRGELEMKDGNITMINKDGMEITLYKIKGGK